MVTASLISRLSQAVDQLEERLTAEPSAQGRDGSSWLAEDQDAAVDRHFAAHPEDRDANIVIFKFCDDEEMAGESQDRSRRADSGI